jgi:aminopeptidase N
MRFSLFLCALVAGCVLPLVGAECLCEQGKRAVMPMALDNLPGKKYARDRLVDIRHVALEVTPDFAKRSVAGTMSMEFAPIALPLRQFELDAVNLGIHGVTADPPLAEWQNTGRKLVLAFQSPVAADAIVKLSVQFSVVPKHGMYFRTPEMGYKAGDTQLWTQGEAEFHRHWFPCYDYPNERFTTEITCHAPADMHVISNGRLVNRTPAKDGLSTWHWKQEKPHVNYLIALAVGHYHKLERTGGGVPMALYVPPSMQESAELAFRDTPAIMDFYQKETGIAYPWAKYDQVYCLDFLAGGMENTSATFNAAGALFTADVENLDTLQDLDAHELAHQWFGDLVTCRDWSHLWLNEGFASYYPMLYAEHKSGRDAMQEDLWNAARRVIDSKDTRPMVWKDYGSPMMQFDSRAYPRGAWVLHMLRSQLGPELFRKGINTYVQRHQNSNVSTDDLQDVMEEVSGRSFDQFFDQWVHHGGNPELKAEYDWDAGGKLARITVSQTQKVTPEVLLFRFPLPVRFWLKDEAAPRDFTVMVSRDREDFYFALPSAPELVAVDPDFTVLASLDFNPPPPMLERRLKGDFYGRLLAIRKLAEQKEPAKLPLLVETLKSEGNAFIRGLCVKALQNLGSDDSIKVLGAHLQHPDAKTRKDVVTALASFNKPEVHALLDEQAKREKNPEILAQIIGSWDVRPGDPQIQKALRDHLWGKSSKNMVAAQSIEVLQSHDEQSASAQIQARLQANPLDFSTRSYARALEAIGFLNREEKSPDSALEFVIRHLNDPREGLRVAAVRALGSMGHPKALPALRQITAVPSEFKDSLREAAEKAVADISANKQGPAELKKLWEEIQGVQKKNQDLEAELKKIREKKPVAP